MDKLVSVITPCYNGEQYIRRFLDCFLHQTYQNIEVILVDDGSTDGTAEIVRQYIPRYAAQGRTLNYLYQQNAGQAAAVNAGLKVFRGEYVAWPDSDDISMPDAIEKKVRFLESHPEFGFVRSDGYLAYDSDIGTPIRRISQNQPNRFHGGIFEDLINETTFVTNHCYLARASALRESLTDLTIYPSRSGQNWQLLLPLAHKFKCGFIDEPLCTYVARDDSHSRAIKKSIESLYNQLDGLRDIMIQVLGQIGCLEQYRSTIEQKFTRRKFYYAIMYRNKDKARESYRRLVQLNCATPRERAAYLMSRTGATTWLYNSLRKWKGQVKW